MKREPVTVLFLHKTFYFTSCKLIFFKKKICWAFLAHLTMRKKKKEKENQEI